MPKELEEDNYDEDDYAFFDEIDFNLIQRYFHELPLFDDMYLNMQGINVSLVDQFITKIEYDLLKEYFDTEGTPKGSALFVSAQSQMWIFALYELMRTWRLRIDNIMKWAKNSGLDTMIKNLSKFPDHYVAIVRIKHLKQAKESGFRDQLAEARAETDDIFRCISMLRVNLAKQEIPQKPNGIPVAPGYGRISMRCGAMNYWIDVDEKGSFIINRRDIADGLRELAKKRIKP